MDETGCKSVIASHCEKKGLDYRCPECGKTVLLKRGRVKIPHFAHAEKLDCTYHENEGPEHLETKMWLYNYFSSNGVYSELECRRWSGIRPDIAAYINGNWIGVEVQKSDISIPEIERRNKTYAKNGVDVVWLMPKSFYTKTTNDEFRMKEQELYFRRMYDWTIFAFDGNEIHAIQVDQVQRWIEEAYNQYGEPVGGYYKWLSKTFRVEKDRPIDFMRIVRGVRKIQERRFC